MLTGRPVTVWNSVVNVVPQASHKNVSIMEIVGHVLWQLRLRQASRIASCSKAQSFSACH
jgi:hypothetical protein